MNARSYPLAIVLAVSLVFQALPAGARNPDREAGGTQLHKLGPLLRLETQRQERLGRDDPGAGLQPLSGLLHTVTGSDGVERIPCWIRHDGSVRYPATAMVGMDRDGIATAHLTLEEIDLLSRQPGVLRITEAHKTALLLDDSILEIGASTVHNGSGTPPVYTGLTGQGVVVGIVDTGIDIEHEDFLDEDGNTRVAFLWDQTVNGNPPAGFGYGSEWTAAEIDAGLCTQTDTNGHGTHVAGIAAGNGSATGNGQPAWTYVGVAPEATLIIVNTTLLSTHVTDGVDYIFRKAQAMGFKAVVNLSLGNHYGPHDGTSEFDLLINALAGPDRIVVAAAGNSQASAIHAEAAIAPGDSAVIIFEVPGYVPAAGSDNDLIYIDGYYPASSTIRAKVVSPGLHSTGFIEFGQTYDQNTPDGAVYLENTDVPGGVHVDRNIFLSLYDSTAANPPAEGEWRIVLHNNSGMSAPPAVADFWIFYTSIAGSIFTQGMTPTKLVASPATADSVIAVGSYTSKNQWTDVDGNTYQIGAPVGAISGFSSHGPRRDGLLKPDVAAPGQLIGAALSSDIASPPTAQILEDGVHLVLQGTSMAAPHVAGLVALMLQQQSRTTAEALFRLQTTSRADGNTGATPNSGWGWGKIDALAATEIPSPILIYAVDARWEEAGGVILEWTVPGDLAGMRFMVHRSTYGSAPGLIGESGTGPGYAFHDQTASPGGDPEYWLEPRAHGLDSGLLGPYRPVQGSAAVHSFSVSQPFPNPSNDYVRWQIRTPRAGEVSYDILDPAGRRIWTGRVDVPGAGLHEFAWEGRSRDGRPAASGLYWIRTRWEGHSTVHRVIRIPAAED